LTKMISISCGERANLSGSVAGQGTGTIAGAITER
jgi:hypothetical protein